MKRALLLIALTLFCVVLGGVAAFAVGGVGICARDLDLESIAIAFLCAFGAGFCARYLLWGAVLAFGVPFGAICLVLRAADNDRNYPVIIGSFIGLALLVTLFARPAARPAH